MKNLFGILGLLGLLCLTSINNTQAQVVVKVRPAAPRVVVHQPVKARKGYTWVPGHWRYSQHRSRYVWQQGSWQRNRPGYNYVPGRWVSCTGGHRWVAGTWTPVRVKVNRRPVTRTVVVHRAPRRGRCRR